MHNAPVADPASEASRLLVASDTVFFAQAFLTERLASIRGNMALALSPFVSMFIVESTEWARANRLPGPPDRHEFESDLQNSRQRLKLLSDKRQTMADIEASSEAMAQISRDWFDRLHIGHFASLLRRFQKDLGLYFIRDQVFNTTEVAFLDLGIPMQNFGEVIRDHDSLAKYGYNMAIEWGRHLGWLLSSLAIIEDLGDVANAPASVPIGYLDLHSEKFYADFSSRVAPQRPTLGLVLTSILSTVNTARLLLPLMTGHNLLALLKWRFVALYQAVINLRRLHDEHFRGPEFLSQAASGEMRELLSIEEIRAIGRQRTLRNTLVHYTVREREVRQLREDMPMWGLVEACTNGMSSQELAALTDRGLEIIGQTLSSLVVPSYRPQSTL